MAPPNHHDEMFYKLCSCFWLSIWTRMRSTICFRCVQSLRGFSWLRPLRGVWMVTIEHLCLNNDWREHAFNINTWSGLNMNLDQIYSHDSTEHIVGHKIEFTIFRGIVACNEAIFVRIVPPVAIMNATFFFVEYCLKFGWIVVVAPMSQVIARLKQIGIVEFSSEHIERTDQLKTEFLE